MKNNTVVVRECRNSDIERCITICEANHPEHFFLHEIEALRKFLEDERSAENPYYVVEVDNQIVGCGGVHATKETMRFCWGMIHPHWQGKGLGTKLVEHRIEWGQSQLAITTIALDTSQKSVGFYQRFGFKVIKFTKDGIGPGLDQYDMERPLQFVSESGEGQNKRDNRPQLKKIIAEVQE